MIPAVLCTLLALRFDCFPGSSELQGSYGKANTAGLVDSRIPRETSLLLELLFNLSSGNPAVVVPWLMGCAPEYSSWGALKGLEVNMNHRDEQVHYTGQNS